MDWFPFLEAIVLSLVGVVAIWRGFTSKDYVIVFVGVLVAGIGGVMLFGFAFAFS